MNTPAPMMDLWVTERYNDQTAVSYKIKETLYHAVSDFQTVDIVDTEFLGRMLLLDGMVMTSEKDEFIYHEMISHIPMLAHHDYAEMTRHVGELGSAAIAAGEGYRAACLYWHSVEFGLAREHGELKILGAGLASSFGEAHFSLESDEVERLPFSAARAVNTPYKHDAFQPRYLVSETLEGTIAEVLGLSVKRLLNL